jgi:hypothetical protein
MPILQFPPSLVLPMVDGTDSREVEYLLSEMQRDLDRYNGQVMGITGSSALSSTMTRWEHRLGSFIPGIRFTSAFKRGVLRVIGFIDKPKYVLVIRSKVRDSVRPTPF